MEEGGREEGGEEEGLFRYKGTRDFMPESFALQTGQTEVKKPSQGETSDLLNFCWMGSWPGSDLSESDVLSPSRRGSIIRC